MNAQQLKILAEQLIRQQIAIASGPIRSKNMAGRLVELEVGDTSAISNSSEIVEDSYQFYLELLRQNRFSFVLFDGSIVQLRYRVRGRNLVSHRFCYIAAPFDEDFRELEGADLIDFAESIVSSKPMDNPRRGTLRLEYDPTAATIGHPSAHLHIYKSSCRIAVKAPMSAKDFMVFLIRNFYSNDYPGDILGEAVHDLPTTIGADELRVPHLSWIST